MAFYNNTPTPELAKDMSISARENDPLAEFRFVSPSVVNGGVGCVTFGNGSKHPISDSEAFYAALGFEPDTTPGLLPDEFLWDRYIREGAPMSEQCLKVQMLSYLFENSQEFRFNFGARYAAVLGSCNASCLNPNDAHCAKCPIPTGTLP